MNTIRNMDPVCRSKTDRLRALLDVAREYGTIEIDPSWSYARRCRIWHYRWLYGELQDMGMYSFPEFTEDSDGNGTDKK